MTPYFLVLLVAALAAIASISVSPRYGRIIAVPAYLLLLLFMGLREHVGGDWGMYMHFFDVYENAGFLDACRIQPTDPGYGWINWAIGHATHNFHTMQLSLAAILLAGLWRLSRCFDIDLCLALFIACPYLLFVAGMGYNRQAVAIGFAFMAMVALRENKNLQFWMFLVLATLCHTSAPIFLVPMWANSFRKAVIAAVAVAVALAASLQEEVLRKFNGYYVGQTAVASGVWFRIGIFAFGMLFLWLQRRRWAEDPKTYSLLKRSAFFVLVAALFAQSQSSLVDRFCLYFFFAYIITVGRSLQYASSAARWLVAYIVFAESLGVFIVWFSTSSFARSAWTPYRIAFY